MTAATLVEREGPSDGPTLEPEEPPSDAPLEADDVYHLLRTKRRRLVLRYLRGREGPHVMRDVAEQVAAWEHDTTVEELRSKERQRVYIALYQTHLPRLDEAGVIEYNQSRGIVETTDRIHQLYDVIDVQDGGGTDVVSAAGGASRDPTAYFGSASLASTGLLTAAWAGLIALPGVVVATIVTALFALLTVSVTVGR